MDAKAKRRLEVGLQLARDAGNLSLGADVIVALPDDRMDTVFGRLRRYSSGATIVVATEDDSLTIVNMKRARGAVLAEDKCPIHQDTLVAMWLAYLRVAPKTVVCYLAPGYKPELVSQGS